MSVKIQFATELENVPYEVSRLLGDVRTKTYKVCDDLSEVEFALQSDTIDLQELQSQLEKMKSFITVGIKSLTRVEDAMSILVGFYQVKTAPPPVVQETPPDHVEVFDDLEQYAKDHKEELSDS